MLSICIPIYNFDVRNLVQSLLVQSEMQNDLLEIILIDDASKEENKTFNQQISNPITRYIELPQNIGRAAIRNLFLKYSTKKYLLFLDCDSMIQSPNFIFNYLNYLKSFEVDVLVGGREYPSESPGEKYNLRWKYGIERESKIADIRNLHPNISFMTNNFVIKKEIFQKLKFDENLKLYGHEDTLFGFELKQKGIRISHIQNPILNGDIEENDIFLQKTTLAIDSLISILKFNGYNPEFVKDVKLLKTFNRLKKIKLTRIFLFFFLLFEKRLENNLLKNSNLFLFDLFKLGQLSKKMSSAKIS